MSILRGEIWNEIGKHLSTRDLISFCQASNEIYENVSMFDHLVHQQELPLLVRIYSKSPKLKRMLEEHLAIFRTGKMGLYYLHRCFVTAVEMGELWIAQLLEKDIPYETIRDAINAARVQKKWHILEYWLKSDDSNFVAGWNFALQKAAEAGDQKFIALSLKESKISKVLDLNYAFVRAICYGKQNIVKLFIESEKEVNISEGLCIAANAGHPDIFERLLQDPRTDAAYQDNSCFRSAAKGDNLKIVQLLLREPRVHPPPEVLAGVRNPDILEYLLDDPRFDPSAFNNSAIIEAIFENRLQIYQILMKDPRVDPSARNNQCIFVASSNGNESIVDSLLQDPRVDPCDLNNRALMVASNKGHLRVVRRLLHDLRVKSTASLKEVFVGAAANGHGNIIEYFLEKSLVDMSTINDDIIRWKYSRRMVECLIKYPNINLSEDALLSVIRDVDSDALKLMLKHPQIDPSINDNMAIKLAFRSEAFNYGLCDVVCILLQDPRVNVPNPNEYLLSAIKKQHFKVVDLLLQNSQINPSFNDNLAIRMAAQRGHTEIVDLLLQDSRVDPLARNKECLRLAIENGRSKVVRRLLQDSRFEPRDVKRVKCGAQIAVKQNKRDST